MKLMEKKLGKYAVLRGYLHEYDPETPNIKEYPAICRQRGSLHPDRIRIDPLHPFVREMSVSPSLPALFCRDALLTFSVPCQRHTGHYNIAAHEQDQYPSGHFP